MNSHPSPPKPSKPFPAKCKKPKSQFKESEMQMRSLRFRKDCNAKTTAMTKLLYFQGPTTLKSHPSLHKPPNPFPAKSNKTTSQLNDSEVQMRSQRCKQDCNVKKIHYNAMQNQLYFHCPQHFEIISKHP